MLYISGTSIYMYKDIQACVHLHEKITEQAMNAKILVCFNNEASKHSL